MEQVTDQYLFRANLFFSGYVNIADFYVPQDEPLNACQTPSLKLDDTSCGICLWLDQQQENKRDWSTCTGMSPRGKEICGRVVKNCFCMVGKKEVEEPVYERLFVPVRQDPVSPQGVP